MKTRLNLHTDSTHFPAELDLRTQRLYFPAKKVLFFLWWWWHPTEDMPSYRFFKIICNAFFFCIEERKIQWGGRPWLKSNKSDLQCWLISVPAHPFRSFTHCSQSIRNGFSRWSSRPRLSSSWVKVSLLCFAELHLVVLVPRLQGEHLRVTPPY